MSPAIGMQLSRTGAKALFFDRRKVQDAMDRTTRRVFSRYGAVTRLDAKRSLRKRKSGAPSPPGQPPRSRTGLLRRSIYYAADLRKRSVVIGPVRLSKGDDAPELHEYGGTAKRRFVLEAQPAHGEARAPLPRQGQTPHRPLRAAPLHGTGRGAHQAAPARVLGRSQEEELTDARTRSHPSRPGVRRALRR
jgi:hypothetical protein